MRIITENLDLKIPSGQIGSAFMRVVPLIGLEKDNNPYTVGAQSIACAQSIAPSLIGDNIC